MRMNKKGFTLVELMIVLAILGLLAGIGIPSYLNVLNRAKIGTDIARIAQVQANVNAFIAEIGQWTKLDSPVKIADLDGDIIPNAVKRTSLITGINVDLAEFFDDGFKMPKLESELDTGAAWYVDEDGNVYVGTEEGKMLPPVESAGSGD